MKPKFNIGDTVKVKADGEIGEVVGFSYDLSVATSKISGFRYKITSREVDFAMKEVIDGFKNCLEEELEVVKVK